MKVVVFLNTNVPAWNPSPAVHQHLRSNFQEINFSFPSSAHELFEELADADVFFSWVMTDDLLNRAKNLKWFHTAGIQYGQYFPTALFDRAIVTNSRGAHAIPVSENLMGMTLMMARQLKSASVSDVSPEGGGALQVRSLSGLILGIVGLGNNGTALARLARSFGMKVVATKRTVARPVEAVDQLWPPEYFNELLNMSDVVALTAPLTHETEKLFKAEAFLSMKNGSILVSSSRPQLVDEVALMDALEDGVIAGVGVDDQWPKDSPLFGLPHVVVSPHITPSEPSCWTRLVQIFSTNLRNFIASKPLMNVMDRGLLY